MAHLNSFWFHLQPKKIVEWIYLKIQESQLNSKSIDDVIKGITKAIHDKN